MENPNYMKQTNKNAKNEYILWLKQTQFMTPYLRYNPAKVDEESNKVFRS